MATIQSLDDLDEAPHAHLFDGAEPRTIRLALEAGESVPEHQHAGKDIVIFVIEGAVDLSLDGEVHELVAGDVIRFEGEQDISPEAQEDSAALVVLAERGE